MTTETEFQKALKDELLADDTGTIENVSTFKESGMPTNSTGLVVKLWDESKFQVTIVKSR